MYPCVSFVFLRRCTCCSKTPYHHRWPAVGSDLEWKAPTVHFLLQTMLVRLRPQSHDIALHDFIWHFVFEFWCLLLCRHRLSMRGVNSFSYGLFFSTQSQDMPEVLFSFLWVILCLVYLWEVSLVKRYCNICWVFLGPTQQPVAIPTLPSKASLLLL